jgi:AcrR family transcriptional regulator
MTVSHHFGSRRLTVTEVTQGRRERKKEETRRRITLAALELFHEKGFEATTVDEITERADVAKGTFFNYFPRKESVLAALSEEWMERAEEHAAQHGRTASERILALFGGVAESYGQDRALAGMLLRVSMERMVCPEPDVSRSGLYQRVVQVVQDGQESGEFRPELSADSVFGVVASVFLGTLVWWVGGGPHQAVVARSTVSLHDAVESQLSIALEGIRVPAAGVKE